MDLGRSPTHDHGITMNALEFTPDETPLVSQVRRDRAGVAVDLSERLEPDDDSGVDDEPEYYTAASE
ncbi:hypothetical protein NE857_13420 [Nocardiopsis exhalans]|uniref:ATP-grasp target RiPP n=1 Tax=Nocardiopsis exhalans TaxID=163604 RepID=A0ABY5DGB0_9ACTN|nr:hypothetical protein [Nocardiopsis exhalans]USY22518.1 hypothetical protein NE857_13420 [Nocardiopsis exhalans]